MFPNSDTSETQNNETVDCTAAPRSRVRRLSVALLAAITLVVGITAAGQLSVAEAAGTVVAVDDAGADDEPGQKDLNWLSIDYGAPGATSLTVKWGSEAYFRIVRQKPDLAKALAQGKRVVVVVAKNQALRIDNTGKETLTAADLRALGLKAE